MGTLMDGQPPENTHRQPPLKDYVNSHKKFIIISGSLVGLLIVGVIIGVLLLPKIQQSEQPALKVGQTTISQKQYNSIVADSAKNEIPKEQVEATITDYARAKEAARQLDITVPAYFIAAQVPIAQYVPYNQLSEYDKAAYYVRALNVMVALAGEGGAIVTALYEPYSAKPELQRSLETNQKAAEDSLALLPQRVANSTVKTDALHDDIMLAFMTPSDFYAGNRNDYLPAIGAITASGKNIQYVINEETGEGVLAPTDVDGQILSLITKTKDSAYSPVTKVDGKDAYIGIYKDKTLKADSELASKYATILASLKNEVAQ